MTRLAIIGGGIAGKSLLYALAKRKKRFSEIILFDSDNFAHTCSLRSTAIVAQRGLTLGHSELGDFLMSGFQAFQGHVQSDLPAGVFPITQFTGALTKLDEFNKRYPNGTVARDFAPFSLQEDVYMASESAYLIDPEIYLEWLLSQSSSLPFKIKNDFVINVDETSRGVEIKTQDGHTQLFDSVVFAAGSGNRFWKGLADDGLANSKPVQGSYLEFKHVDLGNESFSLTLEGDNLIYHAHSQKLLVGSTTEATHTELPAIDSLQAIHQRLQTHLKLNLPDFSRAKIKTGIREKAAKRSPYIKHKNKCWWIGGFYKNGFSLGYDWANKLIQGMDAHD